MLITRHNFVNVGASEFMFKVMQPLQSNTEDFIVAGCLSHTLQIQPISNRCDLRRNKKCEKSAKVYEYISWIQELNGVSIKFQDRIFRASIIKLKWQAVKVKML